MKTNNNNMLIGIYDFIKLYDEQKVSYIQITYPAGKDEQAEEYDFGVFENVDCELCDAKNVKGYGTSDSREPKFCRDCFISISKDTEFKKVEI